MSNTLRFINNLYARHGLMQMADTCTQLDKLTVVARSKRGTAAKVAGGRVQVITPLGPCRDFLATTARALASQTLPCDWWLVVDGAAPTSAALPGLPPGQPRLLCEIAQGAYGARNQGLKHATGDFITVHDADDWSHPQKLEMQVRTLLDNPKAVASVSHWARCSTDMQLETRSDGTVVHRNVSSLMIRREVVERLGYWDRVSVNADTEYYYRILAAYGPESIVEVLPGVPLALGRRHAESLTMQPQTHWQTQFGGVRKEYMDAAHEWHKECAKTGNWYLPFAPTTRPFPVPELIDRAVLALGERVWPHIRGQQGVDPGAPCILLCGHAAGDTQFGAERSLLDLAKAIDALGYRLVVSLPERNLAYFELLKPYCSDIVLLPCPWRENDAAWPVALAAYGHLIAHFKVVLVHGNSLVNRVPLMAARQQGVASVLHVRELLGWDSALSQAMGGATKCAPLLLADRLIANSAYTARCLLAQQPQWQDKLSVVTNTVTLGGDWQAPVVSAGSLITVGMISSNLPKKGLHDFMAVARAALELELPLRFLLIGPANEHTATLATQWPENVVLAGYAESPELALAQLDIVLNLSHFQESFGRSVAEAMLAAKPVIAYRWGALPELVDNGITGYLVHQGDVAGVVQRLAYLCQQPQLITRLGQQGQCVATHRFTASVYRNALAAAYQSLLG
ncbi:glycosyltransferase [Aeromonas sp. QDB21]|uniref:glycosyltransferase n=1 Tax=Aeromonas sp. QDB21 TaxID=2990487 RepID=UPI0022E63168|nr:glycosyltransferase [Aeromonas sp. QDB21]